MKPAHSALRALFGSKKSENDHPLFAGFLVENVQSLKREEVNKMGITLNSRILLGAASILAAIALITGATFAFFSDTETSTGNTFASGTLDVSITDQNSDDLFQGEAVVSDWKPGNQTFVNFDVKNVGSLPVNLRGFAAGTWNVPALDSQNMVKVVQVERWDGSSWANILSNPSGITGYFYWSPNGNNSALYTVNAGDRAQLRLTVEFDPDAGNDFQGQTFTSSLQVEAKQINDSTSW